MEELICTCGSRCHVVDGQQWDQDQRRYVIKFQVACYRCGRGGPVCGDRGAAIEAWRREKENDQMS